MVNHQFENKLLNVVIVEKNRHQGRQLSELIKAKRPRFKVLLLENSEQIFPLMEGEINIDIFFFDIEEEVDTENLTLLKVILPQTSLIHWSDYRHPEVIELLYSLGVNSFCTKESDADIILEAIDLATNYPQSLYVDRELNRSLPLF